MIAHRSLVGILGSLLWAMWGMGVTAAEPHAFHFDDCLGTSLDLVVLADDPAVAARAESAVLSEIDRLASIVSTYDASSELSRWLAAGSMTALSPDLTALLRRCDHWTAASGGGFHPGVAVATRVWTAAEAAHTLPSSADVAAAAAAMRQPPWRWSGEEAAASGIPISVDAVAKGMIVDRACDVALAVGGVHGAMVNIGGDLGVRGDLDQAVVVVGADPHCVVDSVTLADRAIATSGHAHRGFSIGGVRYSHIIDPRTGRPAEGVASATVVAASAADADALATICCVLSTDDALAIVESTPAAACLLVRGDGQVTVSSEWRGREHGRGATRVVPVAASASQGTPAGTVVLDLEINRPVGGRLKRPYVAAWVEDADGFPVKTLLLWVQKDGPGPRWIPDLKRWHRADRLRKLAEDSDLVQTISEATRQPGSHAVTWDGTDNGGLPLPPGDYVLCLEAAREHGTYQFERRPLVIGSEPRHESFEGGTEIKAASFDYRPAGARP